jgi:putative phosphonate transport system ATP-binding protein
MSPTLLSVRNLTRIYGAGCPRCLELTAASGSSRCSACASVVGCAGISLDLRQGETLGVIGESGSGKSTLVRCLALDEPADGGAAVYQDEEGPVELFALDARRRRWLRQHRFGMVYQNPHLGLNFRVSAGANIAERLLMKGQLHYGHVRARTRTLLELMEVPAERMDDLPGRLSGGMQQRIQIARALATDPPLLFLDEVTTGLDLSVQARILDLILDLQRRLHLSIIAVTHDLGVVRLLAGRCLVMRHGRVVEAGLTDQVLEDPQHPYTQHLVASAL